MRILCAVRDLSPPGDLVQTEKYGFEFNDVEMQYDSYRGLQVRLRCVPQRRSCSQYPYIL